MIKNVTKTIFVHELIVDAVLHSLSLRHERHALSSYGNQKYATLM